MGYRSSLNERSPFFFIPDIFGRNFSGFRTFGLQICRPSWYREHFGGGKLQIMDTWWQTETGCFLVSPLPITPLKPGSPKFPMQSMLSRSSNERTCNFILFSLHLLSFSFCSYGS